MDVGCGCLSAPAKDTMGILTWLRDFFILVLLIGLVWLAAGNQSIYNHDDTTKETTDMSDLNQVLKQMDFQFFGSGEHGMSIEGMRKVIGNDHFLFLDVRANEEVKHLSFPFALHIPLNDLPDRLAEVPRDKFIVAFCSSVFRGAVAYTYLLASGYEEVKGLTASSEDMAKAFKPGPLSKM